MTRIPLPAGGNQNQSLNDRQQGFVALLQSLRHDPGFPDGHHEVRITVPARKHVKMQVLRDSRPGALSPVIATVESLGMKGLQQGDLHDTQQGAHLGQFFGSAPGEIGVMTAQYQQ